MMPTQKGCSNEAEHALEFYKTIVRALRASGWRQVLVTLTKDGKLEADMVEIKSPRREQGDNKRGSNAAKQSNPNS